MKPTLESLQQLAATLPLLNFADLPDQEAWLDSEPVQSYLDHYHINFRRERLCQRYNFGKFCAAGFELAVHIWQPEKPRGTIFLLHGFTDSVGLMQHPVRFFLQQNWAVVAFDLPGHGLSSGTQASIESFDQYRDVLTVCIRRCHHVLPKPWHGVGQSTGAAVWLDYMATYVVDSDIDKVLLLAPLVRPTNWRWTGWLLPLYRSLASKIPRTFALNSHDEGFMAFVREDDPLQTRVTPMRWAMAMAGWIKAFRSLPRVNKPITIIQGDEDTTVDFRYNVPLIRKKFPHNRLVIIPGGRHQLCNEAVEFRQKVFRHVQEWLESS